MSVEAGSTVTYRSRRRLPPVAGHNIVVQPGSPLAAEELTERDHFLTGRWRAFTKIASRLVTVPVEHQPWPLWRVRIDHVNQNLLTTAGLPAPDCEPAGRCMTITSNAAQDFSRGAVCTGFIARRRPCPVISCRGWPKSSPRGRLNPGPAAIRLPSALTMALPAASMSTVIILVTAAPMDRSS
jgi:Uncharacterized conserved protein (COG2071)